MTKCTLVPSVLNVANYMAPEALFSCCATLLSWHICSNLHLECVISSSRGPCQPTALAPKPLRAQVCSDTRLHKQINKSEMAVFDPQQPLASFFGTRYQQPSRPSYYKQCGILFFFFSSHPSLSRRPVQSIDRSIKVQILSRRRSKPLITFKSQ